MCACFLLDPLEEAGGLGGGGVGEGAVGGGPGLSHQADPQLHLLS